MSVSMQTIPGLKEFREKAEQIEDLVTPPESIEEAAKDRESQTSFERRLAWHRRVADAVLDLSNSMPAGLEDYDVRKLLELVVQLRVLLDADPNASDSDGAIELATMRTADVARRLHRRLVHDQLDDPQVAVRMVLDGLAQLQVSEIARLMGVSTKTIRAWQQRNPVRQNVKRVVLVAQLLSYLRSSMSAMGVMMWFEAERDQLNGRTPLQLLEDDVTSAFEPLSRLARGTRGQLAG
jgi:DNA-binding transcriptional regulator YiaG